jgi:hypothetical protein
MTGEEIQKKGEELANLELKIAEGEKEIVEVKNEAKAQIKDLSDRLSGKVNFARKIAREIESGNKFETVVVEERLSEDTTKVETFRTDTEEVVDERAANEEDKQTSFEDIVDETLEKVADDTEAAEAMGEQDEVEEDRTGIDASATEDVDGSEFFDEDEDKDKDSGEAATSG